MSHNLSGVIDIANIALGNLSRAVVVCLVLAVLPKLINKGGGPGSPIRGLVYIFVGILAMAGITLIGSAEEALNFLPSVNLRVWMSPYTWLFYAPIIFGLERFRRALK